MLYITDQIVLVYYGT